MANFNPELMREAQHRLESIRDQHLSGISPHAVQSLLNLVRIRTEPEARLRELSAALSGPKPDPDFMQDLDDLTWYLNAKVDSLPVREDAWDEVANTFGSFLIATDVLFGNGTHTLGYLFSDERDVSSALPAAFIYGSATTRPGHRSQRKTGKSNPIQSCRVKASCPSFF